MTRSAYVDRDREFLIFWSPKAGCSSLVDWWVSGPVGKDLAELGIVQRDKRRWLRRNGYEVPFDKVGDYLSFRKIAIARNPFDRAVSAYVDKFVGRNGAWIDTHDKLNAFAANFWRDVRGETAEYDGLSFIEFLREVNKRVAERGRKEPSLNHHFNTQVPFAFSGRTDIYDEIYDLAEMQTALARIAKDYGFSARPGHSRSTNYDAFDGKFIGHLSSVEIGSERLSIHRDSFRNDETEALVHRAYEIDYQTFGYEGA